MSEIKFGRREFLRYVGYFLGAALLSPVLASCMPRESEARNSDSERKVKTASPSLEKPRNMFVQNNMRFISVDSDISELATYLNTMKSQKIQPAIVFETYCNTPGFSWDAYYIRLTKFLQDLQSHGVPAADLGTVIVFPEPNIPGELSIASSDFKNRYLVMKSKFQSIFPNIELALLFNTMSYPSTTEWKKGVRRDLSLYISPNEMPKTIYLQWFPWVQPKGEQFTLNGSTPELLASNGLPSEVFGNLQGKDIRINTGILVETNFDGKLYKVSEIDQNSMATNLINQIKSLKQQRILVKSVNLFIENKLNKEEHKNWHIPEKLLHRLILELNTLEVEVTTFDPATI